MNQGIAFARTLRALDADDFRASKFGLLAAAALLAAWTWWMLAARLLPGHESTTNVRIEPGRAIAYFPSDAVTRMRAGQTAILRFSSEAFPAQVQTLAPDHVELVFTIRPSTASQRFNTGYCRDRNFTYFTRRHRAAHLTMKRARLIVPEVVQTSNMDCGPAALKSLLEGFGIPVNYGRLREACQTGVDGTSIDTIEEVANQLGLRTEQIMLPSDHVLIEDAHALPAIAVVVLPSGVTHFVIVWRRFGRFVELMDPAVGRRWVSAARFLSDLYLHRQPAAADFMKTSRPRAADEGRSDKKRAALGERRALLVRSLSSSAARRRGRLARVCRLRGFSRAFAPAPACAAHGQPADHRGRAQ